MDKVYKNRIFYGFIGMALLLSMFSGLGCDKSSVGANSDQVYRVPVKVAAATAGTLTEKVTLVGKVAPLQEVNVVSKSSGKVVLVAVDVGSSVEKDQLLVQLDTSDVLIQLKEAEARLAIALATQKSAGITLENARIGLQRAEELYAQEIIAKRDLEAAQMQFDQANSGMAAAQVQQAEAAIEAVRNQLQNHTITASIGGQISSRKINLGEMAGPGAPVLKLVDISRVVVECNVPEGQINRVSMGDKIKVKISAAASESFEGQVTSIAPASDPQSKSFPVKIELVNPEQIFKPGMFAEVELAVAVHDQVLLLPKEAIVDKGDIRVVYLVRDGWTHETKVKTGISDANSIIILEGLQAGDQVVAVGQNTVQDQTPVEVVQDPSEVITDGN